MRVYITSIHLELNWLDMLETLIFHKSSEIDLIKQAMHTSIWAIIYKNSKNIKSSWYLLNTLQYTNAQKNIRIRVVNI